MSISDIICCVAGFLMGFYGDNIVNYVKEACKQKNK